MNIESNTNKNILISRFVVKQRQRVYLLWKIAALESNICRQRKNIRKEKCAAANKKESDYTFQKKIRHLNKNISKK